MKITKQTSFLLIVWLTTVAMISKASVSASVNYLPQTPGYSESVATFSYEGVSQGVRLAAVSLQGLVNRDTARIYLLERQSRWLLDLYKEQGIIKNDTAYTNIYTLLKNFKRYFKGAVVFDPTKGFTVNVASNIAGIEDRVIISPDMLTLFKRHLGSEIDIKDLRNFNFPDALSAYTWYEQNVLPLQSKSFLSVADRYYMHDVYRDYLIQHKVPTFWLPGTADADYNTALESKIINLLSTTPPNIPVLGFWPGVDDNGKSTGYEEYAGVKLAGRYGKFTLVNTWVGNYSFHTAINNKQISYKQTKVRAKEYKTYDPSKKYVALIMIESGDSPAYLQYGLNQRQWSDPYRGQVPISYGITPSVKYLLPGLTKYLYDTATENDFFFCSISGAGYCYPFEGYCDLTVDPAKNKRDYFSITAENMKMLDMDMMGLYTHPGSKWTTTDKQIAKTYIEPMKGLKSIISGMHRVGYTGANGSEILDSVTVHHTLTFWPMVDIPWDDTSKDESAVNFLENEIKTYGAGGNFIQAMFYSWIYGPRRLKQLKDKMEAQGYVFVTLNEFDYLCRVARNWKQIVNTTTAVDTLNSEQLLQCYPNPSSGTVFFPEALTNELTIRDITGKLIASIAGENIDKIDLGQYGKGIYFLKTTNGLTSKIVII